MYSVYKLNEQGDNIQPWCTSFPIWKQSVVPCPVLTVASWSAYRFLRRHVLEGTNRTLFAPGPRIKEQCPHKRLTQTCPWVSRSLWQRCGSEVACCRVGGIECSSFFMHGTFWRKPSYLHYFHHSLASGQIIGREHNPTHQQKMGLKIYWAQHPPIRTRPNFPLSQSFPLGNFHKPFILLHQRAHRMKSTIAENQPIWSHRPQPCPTQWNYEPCHVGLP